MLAAARRPSAPPADSRPPAWQEAPFDSGAGVTVVPPLASGPGWWAGACSAAYDAAARRILLYYRYRKPREQGRGVACEIAASADGLHFQPVWRATQKDLQTPSIERGALRQLRPDCWALYLSFVDPNTQQWRIDVLTAPRVEDFTAARRQPVAVPYAWSIAGVKDPWLWVQDREWRMLVSFVPLPSRPIPYQRLHGTGDVYTTGLSRSCTGLATSPDGLRFTWHGQVFGPGRRGRWDAYAGRVACLVPASHGFWAPYDGSPRVAENYEECTGMAWTPDGRQFRRITQTHPLLTSPHSSRSLRYLDVLDVGERRFWYYEYARPDQSHELRCSVTPCSDAAG